MTGSLPFVVWASLVAQMVKQSACDAEEPDSNPEFNSDDHYIYYCGQESFKRTGITHLQSTKESKCSTWMQAQK